MGGILYQADAESVSRAGLSGSLEVLNEGSKNSINVHSGELVNIPALYSLFVPTLHDLAVL